MKKLTYLWHFVYIFFPDFILTQYTKLPHFLSKILKELHQRHNTEISKSWTIVVNLFRLLFTTSSTHPVSLFTRQTWKPIKTSVTL